MDMPEVMSDLQICQEDRGPSLLALAWTLQVFAIGAVSLRVWFRSGLRNGISWDDYFIVASLLGGIIGVAFLTQMVKAGVGRHMFCLAPERIPSAVQWSIYAQIANIIGLGLVKISVCLCVLRVIDKVERLLSRFLWIIIIFVTLSHLAQVLLFLVQCRPMAAIWDPSVKGQCFSSHVTYLAGYVGFALDAFTDLVCAGIPIFIVYRLQMNVRSKIALCILMGLAVFTACCAVAKAIFLKGVFSKDYTWAITEPAYWTVTEHLVGLIIASAPSLRPLFKRLLDVTSQRSSNSSSRSSRTLQRLQGRDRGVHVQISSLMRASSKNQRGILLSDKDITKTTELRVSTETVPNYGQVQQPPNAWVVPDRDRPYGYEPV